VKQASTPEREEMITFLHDRAYPFSKKKGRRIGSEQFLAGLRDQPTNVLESLVESAKKEKQRRSEHRMTNRHL
jgi:hypothetical protein